MLQPHSAAIGTTELVFEERAPVSLRLNFAWTLAGNLTYGLCQWGMLVVIAKLGTPELVGTFALAFAVTAPVIQFANLNLRAVLVTDAHRSYGFGDYLALRIVLLLAANLLIASIAIMAYERTVATIVLFVALAKTFESLSDVYLGYVQQHERMAWVARSLMLKGALSIGALGAGLYLTSSIVVGVAGLAAAWGSMLALVDVPYAKSARRSKRQAPFRLRWNGQVLGRLFLVALPLGIATLLASLQVNVPRYFVERLLGSRELGFFAATAYVTIIGARVVTALGESASPRLARFYAAGDWASYRSLVAKMLGLGLAVSGAAILLSFAFGRQLLTMLYCPEYAQHSGTLVLLMIAASFGYLSGFLQYAMTAARAVGPQPWILAGAVLVCVAASAVLVPVLGLAGAAVAMGLTSGLQFAGNAVVTWRAVRRIRGA